MLFLFAEDFSVITALREMMCNVTTNMAIKNNEPIKAYFELFCFVLSLLGK